MTLQLRRSVFILALLVVSFAGSTAHAAVPLHVSNNWAGYAATDETYTSVSGSWTVPHSTGTDKIISADATWVGIGGVSTSDLIQAGTQAIVRNGRTEYTAWYEMLPNTQQTAPLAVHPGDRISTSVREVSPGLWTITIQNLTTNQTYQNTVVYESSHSSAEWIVERPLAVTSTATGYLPLSDFDDVTFGTATAMTTAGRVVNVDGTNTERLVMSGTGSRLLAAPDENLTVSYLSKTQSVRYLRTLKRTYNMKSASSPPKYEQINTTYVIRIIFDRAH